MSNPLNIDIESVIPAYVSVETLARAEELKNADTCWHIQFPLFKNEGMKILECNVTDVLNCASGIIIEFINTSQRPLTLPPGHPLMTRTSHRIDTFFLTREEAQDAAVMFRLTGSFTK